MSYLANNRVRRSRTPRGMELRPRGSCVETFSRDITASSVQAASGQMRFCHFEVEEPITVSKLAFFTGSAALALGGGTLSKLRYGLYSQDPTSGDLTLIGNTAHDATLFAATFTEYEKALAAAVDLVPGTIYATAPLTVVTGGSPTMAQIVGASVSTAPTFPAVVTSGRPKRSSFISTQTDLPATVLRTALAASGVMPYAVLSA